MRHFFRSTINRLPRQRSLTSSQDLTKTTRKGINCFLFQKSNQTGIRPFHSQVRSVITHKLGSDMDSIRKLSPPGVLHNWDFNGMTREEVLGGMQKLTQRLKDTYEKVGQAQKVSFSTVVEPIFDSHRWFYNEAELFCFPLHVAVSGELRDAANDAKKLMDKTIIDVGMMLEPFKKLQQYKEQAEKSGELQQLHPEYKRGLERLIQMGQRQGLHLDEASRDKIKKFSTRMAELKTDFVKNVAEDETTLLFTAEELSGVSEEFLSSLDTDPSTGKYKITMKYPHILPISRNCRIPETRRQVHEAKASVAKDLNTPILEELLELRQTTAELLGYPDHATYVLETLMPKTPDAVHKFLTDLVVKLQPLWKTEKEQMLALKEEECKENGWKVSGTLDLWDTTYYGHKVEEKFYALNIEDYKPYFPLDHVIQRMFEIYQKLLAVKFTEVENPPVWYEGVTMYSVHDTEDNRLMGYFFMDLFPRSGKYSHYCVETMQFSCAEDSSGDKRVVEVIAMLCNFSKGEAGKPPLLEHDHVETLFHEFGHLMHAICAKTHLAMFSGALDFSCCGVERDFVECPSQMLENWVWHKTPLTLMSSHYQSGEPLPENMIEKLQQTRQVGTGMHNLRQIVFGLFDQRIHKGGRCSTAKVFEDVMKDVHGFDVLPNTNFAASFNHIVRQYDAKYYSYLWSEVFSVDMFDTGFGDDVLSSEKGRRYRNLILEPSGSVDAYDMLRNFLGREPQMNAFLKVKGLSDD